jgi:hypothetical protein
MAYRFKRLKQYNMATIKMKVTIRYSLLLKTILSVLSFSKNMWAIEILLPNGDKKILSISDVIGINDFTSDL